MVPDTINVFIQDLFVKADLSPINTYLQCRQEPYLLDCQQPTNG